MATYYRTGVETYSIIGTADEKDSLEGRIPDGSTYFAVDENMFYTFYDGQWYETLPEAARLYHDDVGTDTKPIKLVGGVATVVANELAEDAKVVHNTGDETVAGVKTFVGDVKVPTYTGAETDRAMNKAMLVTHLAGDGTLVHTTGNETIAGNKTFTGDVVVPTYTGSDTDRAMNKAMLVSHLANDSTLVHTTGNETVAGTKTFNAGLFAGGTTPLLHLRSTGASSSPAWRGVIRVSDKDGNADSDIAEARIVSGSSDSRNSLEIYVAKPDRSSKVAVLIGQAYADRLLMLTTPYYPVDGSSNPQALPANALMASGNIAVDPRLVHTTGNESITGTKTFETGLVGYFKGWIKIDKTANVNDYLIFAKIDVLEGANRFIKFDICNSTNTVPAIASIIFRTELTSPYPRWVYHTPFTTVNNPITGTSIVILTKDGEMFLAWKKENTYGKIMVKVDFESSYGYVQGLNNSRIKIYNTNEIEVVSDISSYTVFGVE